MPDGTNTGPVASTSFTSSGPMTVSTAGAVISGKAITGTLTISANGVTVQNNKIDSTGQLYGINISSGVTGTRIIHNDIYTTTGGYEGIWAYSGTGTFICANHIHQYENTITGGDAMIVQANFINDFNDGPTGGCDDDGMELYSGNHIKIWGNNVMGWGLDGTPHCVNSTIYTGAETNTPQDDVDINGNWIGGAGFTLRVEMSGPNHDVPVTNVQVRNNHWYYTAATANDTFGPVAVRQPGMISVWTNNKWMGDGTTIDNPNP